MKLIKIFAPVKYLFCGDSQVIIRLTKETKDKLIGYITNIQGNSGREEYNKKQESNKITIIKKNVVGWEELR